MFGTDLNRNWDTEFKNVMPDKDPCSETYQVMFFFVGTQWYLSMVSVLGPPPVLCPRDPGTERLPQGYQREALHVCGSALLRTGNDYTDHATLNGSEPVLAY